MSKALALLARERTRQGGAFEDQTHDAEYVALWEHCEDFRRDMRKPADDPLAVALLQCVEHMEWSTPQGKAAHDAARALLKRGNDG